jgi:hypothetical protein
MNFSPNSPGRMESRDGSFVDSWTGLVEGACYQCKGSGAQETTGMEELRMP